MLFVLISVEKTGSFGAFGPLKLFFWFEDEFDPEVFEADEEFDEEGSTEFLTFRLNTFFFVFPEF